MTVITLENLTKIFGSDVKAVDNVNLEIEHGEFVTLVGPSGCGKTTTLRLIAGFERPTEGRVLMGGEDITNMPPYRRDVGMVFQTFALFPHMTVKDNISYGMRVSDQSFSQAEIDDRVSEMLEMIELPGIEDRMPDQLSGGQQQRVALARALALKPGALLLDEPLASLDENLRKQMQAEVTRIQKELGVTTIFVTHNQEEAMTMSDRIVIMNEGKFEQQGSPTEVYHHPDSLFVADFIGKANIFRGPVTDVQDGIATVDTTVGRLRGAVSDESEPLEEGKKVGVVVRPEVMTLVARDEMAPEDDTNVVEGTVNLAQMLGDIIEYRVYTEDGFEILATLPSSEEQARRFERGDAVDIHFPEHASKVIGKESTIRESTEDAIATGVHHER